MKRASNGGTLDINELEGRRPGIKAIFDRMKANSPWLSATELALRARVEWHRIHDPKKGSK